MKNKDYYILCRAIKLKHLSIANIYFNDLFYLLKNKPKHMLWFMNFSKKSGIVWSNKK